jgi:hypothetical protein
MGSRSCCCARFRHCRRNSSGAGRGPFSRQPAVDGILRPSRGISYDATKGWDRLNAPQPNRDHAGGLADRATLMPSAGVCFLEIGNDFELRRRSSR